MLSSIFFRCCCGEASSAVFSRATKHTRDMQEGALRLFGVGKKPTRMGNCNMRILKFNFQCRTPLNQRACHVILRVLFGEFKKRKSYQPHAYTIVQTRIVFKNKEQDHNCLVRKNDHNWCKPEYLAEQTTSRISNKLTRSQLSTLFNFSTELSFSKNS